VREGRGPAARVVDRRRDDAPAPPTPRWSSGTSAGPAGCRRP
jgi:hypothetical protein